MKQVARVMSFYTLLLTRVRRPAPVRVEVRRTEGVPFGSSLYTVVMVSVRVMFLIRRPAFC